MNELDITRAIERHIHGFAPGKVDVRPWSRAPLGERLPGFRIAEIQPDAGRPYWSFLTVGCWQSAVTSSLQAEFVLAANSGDGRHAETIAITAFYNCDYPLGLGGIVELGEPWIEGSSCDHVLVSLPYPYGPGLEIVEGTSIRYRWLLPITPDEASFGRIAGVEELERLFDASEMDFANPARASIV